MGIFNEKHFILQNYRYKIQKITYKPKKNYWDKKLHIEYSELLLKFVWYTFHFHPKMSSEHLLFTLFLIYTFLYTQYFI